jgi:transcriptional regulator with XRE-family HTH domain
MTGDELRALRLRLGLTQTQLAAALDVSASTIAKYEAGKTSNRQPIPRVVELAVRALAARHDRETGERK